jgi:hypothetical protein
MTQAGAFGTNTNGVAMFTEKLWKTIVLGSVTITVAVDREPDEPKDVDVDDLYQDAGDPVGELRAA